MSISRRLFGQAATTAALLAVSPRPAAAQASGLFQHGVASGDPLPTRVVIWTRVTGAAPDTVIPVRWVVAEDANLTKIAQEGMSFTHSQFDYTVKVDVERLRPGTTYYYQFTVSGTTSPIGRAKTAPVGSLDRLRFGVVSCSNYPYGFFNTYALLAKRADLDFILHLGDYIYEYANAQYGDGTPINRTPLPARATTTLSDYRTRYAQYRMDPDLQEAHRQHTFIIVWDDHETANNSWRDGAENHNATTQGPWSARRAQGMQAWIEWMPVRTNLYQNGDIYRTFRFGNLLDLMMLDTRLTGRDEQIPDNNLSNLNNPNRTIMGFEQEGWLYQQLDASRGRDVKWRALGQQIMMSQLFGAAGPLNLDQWDGYPAARTRLLQQLDAQFQRNVFVLSGDIHSSWANEISVNPFAAATARRQMVEFVTPAVTSPGIDDRAQADGLQAQISATHPHVKYIELFRRGYLLVDLTADRVQGEWFHVKTITERRAEEDFARAFQTASGEVKLVAVSTPSAAKTAVAPLAI